MSINVSAFIASLRFMVEGWLGIFVVMGIIIACIYGLQGRILTLSSSCFSGDPQGIPASLQELPRGSSDFSLQKVHKSVEYHSHVCYSIFQEINIL